MRADHLIENYFSGKGEDRKVEGLSLEELEKIVQENKIPCPNCGKQEWTKVRKFNLLFPVQLGIVEVKRSRVFKRRNSTGNVHQL